MEVSVVLCVSPSADLMDASIYAWYLFLFSKHQE